jgi:DUF1680 family protein
LADLGSNPGTPISNGDTNYTASATFIQAGVANYRATGSDKLLNISHQVADHVCAMFGPEGLNKVCGHAEIEPALVELYRVTGERRYLDQASVFIERRGTGTLPRFEFGQAY